MTCDDVPARFDGVERRFCHPYPDPSYFSALGGRKGTILSNGVPVIGDATLTRIGKDCPTVPELDDGIPNWSAGDLSPSPESSIIAWMVWAKISLKIS